MRPRLLPTGPHARTARTVIGRRLHHYVIVELLGGGGMGEVYVADDTKLGRRVALKVPRQTAGDLLDSRARLQREAKAAAALSHPNIVHLYSVEDCEGLLFITMELVRARACAICLSAAPPLPLARTLSFAASSPRAWRVRTPPASLHRDLKPGNVVDRRWRSAQDPRLRAGEAVDLGPRCGVPRRQRLARDASQRRDDPRHGGLHVSRAGARQDARRTHRPVRARRGAVRDGDRARPFAAETLPAVFDQLLNRPHPSPRTLNPALPAFLATVIDSALEKDPERRYGSAADLLDDLRRATSRRSRLGDDRRARLKPASPPRSSCCRSSI